MVQPGAFAQWDNTPRKGRKGTAYFKATPEKFDKYIQIRYENAIKYYNADFLFINAWNEWGEGAHLEPDELNKFEYLEALEKATKKYKPE